MSRYRASSSKTTDVYAQAFEWGEGNEIRYGIAERLRHFRFAAQTIIVIDSCFTQAVYGQHTKRHDIRRIHDMQTIHINNLKLEDNADLIVAQMYELSKSDLFNIYANPTETMATARSMAEEMIDYFPSSVQTKTGIDALYWLVKMPW